VKFRSSDELHAAGLDRSLNIEIPPAANRLIGTHGHTGFDRQGDARINGQRVDDNVGVPDVIPNRILRNVATPAAEQVTCFQRLENTRSLWESSRRTACVAKPFLESPFGAVENRGELHSVRSLYGFEGAGLKDSPGGAPIDETLATFET
jgi:hypothetical protein